MNKKLRKEKLLILGIGNVLMGDDGAGVKVIEELSARALPPHITLLNGEVRGINIMEVLEEHKKILVVDAIKTRERDALVHLSAENFTVAPRALSTHGLDFHTTLMLFKTLGGVTSGITILGIPIEEVIPGTKLSTKTRDFMTKALDLITNEIIGV